MSQKRLLAAAAALALIVVAVFMLRGRSEAGAPAAAAPGRASREATAAVSPVGKTQPAPEHGTSAGSAPASGKLFVQGGWGTGPGEFGREFAPDSAHPEVPLTLNVDSQGNTYVLDQVNGRIVRFDKDGKPLEPFPLTQQTPRDFTISPAGTTLVLDQLRDKSIAVLDPQGRLLGELPVTGKGLAEQDNGLATGVFADADGVYVEKSHTVQYRVGDAAGIADPDQPMLDGRPSRDGQSLLSMGMLKSKPGYFWVRAVDRVTGHMKFMREYALPLPILALTFLDSDASGRIYAAAHIGRELPIPDDGGRGAGFTDESVQLLCLRPTGEPRQLLTLPPNNLPEERVRDMAVRDDGTVLYMFPTEEGMQIRQYSCG